MVKLPQGSLWTSDTAVSGSKNRSAHKWKYCPYSTQTTGYNQDTRVPEIEKVYHSETEGWLHTYSVTSVVGWTCADNDCPFYTGDATTEVDQHGRVFMASGTECPTTEGQLNTLSGTVAHLVRGRTIVSGTRYFEI